ncbi:MAG: YfiR family protein [Bacteroidota bacterium]|nr:YfiR family protein [Bacteroidota bacterium]
MRVRRRESAKQQLQFLCTLILPTPKGRGLRRIVCLLVFLLLMVSQVEGPAQSAVSREYQIKAVFLFNFTQFVEWPSAAFERTSSPLILGILGEDPFGDFIDRTVRGEVAQNRPLVVKRFAGVDELEDCHILFIGLHAKQEVRDALRKTKSKPVLTVSDMDGFARMGGTVRFYSEDGKVRIRINTKSVEEANLVVSSKLLRLADVIRANDN